MSRNLKILLLTAVINTSSCYGWKPIHGPTMAAFTIHQSHPAIGSSSHQTTNHLTGSDTSFEVGEKSIGTTFVSELPSSQEIDDYKGFSSDEARILSGSVIPIDLGHSEDLDEFNNACSVNKYAFDYEGTIHFRNKLPKLSQFTICYWVRFTNHSGDHTILTYTADREPRQIQLWVANSKGSSYLSMAIHGQQIYRLNYPLKMRKWHHACSSWNGKTGEWQLWIKHERVGRGFHNRLVNHEIPGKGILFSGGPSVTGKTTEGLHFEMTLLQIYKVALSAGKAHRDHKHHHVHHFDHDGEAIPSVSTARPQPPMSLPMNPLLANGQIPTRVRINLAATIPQSQIKEIPSQLVAASLIPTQQATINTNFVNGQFHTNQRYIAQQLASLQQPDAINLPQEYSEITQQISNSPQPLAANGIRHTTDRSVLSVNFPQEQTNPFGSSFPSSDGLQYADESRFLFKRQPQKPKIFKRQNEESSIKNLDNKSVKVVPRITRESSKLGKRGLIMLGDGTFIDDTLLAENYGFEGLAQYGIQSLKHDAGKKSNIEDEIKEHDREPAEEEVKAVLHLCNACEPEPFKGAIVLAWKDALINQEGTLKGRSVGGCGYF